MKKIIISAACLAMALASCNQIETPENEYQAMSLGINVKAAVETKGLLTDYYLPAGSSIGVFVTDKSGVTYDGQTLANVKYTGAGEKSSQTWTTESNIMLSNNQANLAAYYPYSEDVTDVKAIPVKATSDIQTDYMWATPVSGLYNKKTDAIIYMNHALAAVRLIVKQGNGQGSVEVTSVAFSSDGAATEALLDATKGTLSSINGQGTQFVVNETFVPSSTEKSFDFITVPAGVSAPIIVELTVNGSKMTALGKSVLLEAGNIYEYTISVDGTNGASVSRVMMSQWEVQDKGSTVIYEEIEYNFDGTVPDPFVEWAAIQHKDGSLYSASKWKAYKTAGLLTDADANGVVVLYSKYAVCPHVIYSKGSDSMIKWSSDTETIVPGVTTTLNTDEAIVDVNGKANTEALLAAVTNGIIPDAPAAQYCADLTFANGQQGYLPAAGEIQAWIDNLNQIQACMTAIGGEFSRNDITPTWSSTQGNDYYAYGFFCPYNEYYIKPQNRKAATQTIYAVTEFTPPTM